MSSPEFYTVNRNTSIEHRVKDSLFIAHLSPAPSRDDAEKYIAEIREKYADATHNCFAYRIGTDDQSIYRFDDDGEPGGSSGRPILQAMEGRALTDAVIVVTRYFGGTKLGVGGLVRAYSGAAFVAMDAAEFLPILRKIELQLHYDFNDTGTVHNVLAHYNAKILETTYANSVFIKIQVLEDQKAEIMQELIDRTRGRIHIQ
ncbi:MAG: YigZ family protein [Deferribacteres bacterium]|nr:YigZ family protein [candidate division KSB1 bacterium]MCB9500573.1 YigZ family protein [Deferribacteres bacterium]